MRPRTSPESGLHPEVAHSLGPPLGLAVLEDLSVLHPWLSGGVSWVASARSPTDGGVQATAPTQPQVKASKLPTQFQWTIQSPPPPDFAPQTSVGSVDLGSRRGGTPSLLKDQTLGPALRKLYRRGLAPLSGRTLGPTTIAQPSLGVPIRHAPGPIGEWRRGCGS